MKMYCWHRTKHHNTRWHFPAKGEVTEKAEEEEEESR